MHSSSQIEIDETAFRKNLAFFRRFFGKGPRISSVIKGNAYGHGIEVFAPMAVANGIDHFSVFSADEAWRLFHCLEEPVEIMIMGYIDNAAMEWVIWNELQFWVYEVSILEQAIAHAKQLGKKALIHLELETGMHRTGLEEKDWPKVTQLIREHREEVEVMGVCTHFAGAESISNYLRIRDQKKVYRRGLAYFREQGIQYHLRHACCSAAAIRYPEMRYDLIRLGILQYGFWPSREIFIEFLKERKRKESPIHRLMSWKSYVMSIKNVEPGEFIGYGTSYLAGIPTRIAIVPVGYSGGFLRSLSNLGRMLVRGHRVAVIGNVNMNSLAIDITEVPEVEIGDEVVIIGHQGDLEISVASFTELSRQLNYEALSRLPERIDRKVVE